MEDTLTDTFNLFFASEIGKNCTDCNATDNLVRLGAEAPGGQIWICQDCQEKRNEERMARREAQDIDIARQEARDEWES